MPRRGLHHRTIDKMHIIVRAELANPLLSTVDLGALIGLSVVRLNTIRNLPLYRQIKNQYMTGTILRPLDQKVEKRYDVAKDTLSFAVPMAMQTLVQQALSAKDERVKNKACNDILDRDGRFAKVTRIGAPTKEQDPGKVQDRDSKDIAEMQAALSSVQAGAVAGPPTIESNPITDTKQ